MKRSSEGGNSPALKHLVVIESSDSDSEIPTFSQYRATSSSCDEINHSLNLDFNSTTSQSSVSQKTDSDNCPIDIQVATSPLRRSNSSTTSSTEPACNVLFNVPSSPPATVSQEIIFDPQFLSVLSKSSPASHLSTPVTERNLDFGNVSYTSSKDEVLQSNIDASTVLENLVRVKGATYMANIILQNEDLQEELYQSLLKKAHTEFKSSLKTSMLKTKKERGYLLSLSPELLCKEFRTKSPLAFTLLAKGLIGVSDENTVFTSQHLMNDMSLILSTVAKRINRLATGFALLLTTEARSGGLREDTIKLISAFVHPRTSQKYDREVLSKDWDANLKECLQEEQKFFREKRQAELRVR